MLESLQIKNFRGISSLSLENLGRINVLIGENGIGKTTTLEAVSVVSNLHPGEFIRLAKWREFEGSYAEALRSVFHQLDTSLCPEFIFTRNRKEHRFAIACAADAETIKVNGEYHNGENGINDFTQSDEVMGIAATYTSPSGEIYEQEYLGSSGEPQFRLLPQHVIPQVRCFYIHGRRATSIFETAQAIDKIADTIEDENLFRDTLSSIDSRVKRIRAGFSGKNPDVKIDVGLSKMLSLNFMGDGFCRVALMLTGIMGSRAKVLVVDEIDSGLHHSTMTDFWRHCIQLTKQFDVQLFCTTHNEEILETAIDAFQDDPEEIKVYRLEQRTEDEIYAASFDYSMLRDAELAGFEIR